jgi:DNA (cytosine-5)-methyltransferase 1
MSQDITGIDFFCGAGGSSTGLADSGVRVIHAANHWARAIETHATNHPGTEHSLDDLRQAHPSWYPRTDIAWFSPECTNHSISKGKKRKAINQLDLWNEHKVDPAEERSRATMREVVEFTEYHRYETVIVENVVDIRHWQFYDEWLTAMLNMGYDYKALYLNAQFFNVPQSRDRVYFVFWQRKNRAPNLDFRPNAVCPKHGQIQAVQSWKKEAHWGRYGQRRQYVYRCPHCADIVEPGFIPAAAVIDWSIPSQKIGDREKPLKPKTIQRILAGLKKFAADSVIVDTTFSDLQGRITPIDRPLATQTTRQAFALLEPFLTSYYTRDNAQSRIDDPIPTITGDPRHALVTPFITSLNHSDECSTGVTEPFPTIMPHVRPSLIDPFVMSYYGENAVCKRTDEPLPTLRTVSHEALITPEDVLPECGFRMLEPHELKLGMSFPEPYVITGNKRDKVKQIGNAVCCNVARWIGQQVVEALACT